MSFDYKGYDEKKLLSLCDRKNANTGDAKWRYGVSEQYSQGRIYREYAGYPSWLSLYAYSDHGIGNPEVEKHELENNAPVMFVFCDEKLANYKNQSSKPCYKVAQPLIWWRKQHNITQAKDAKGTIAFPSHSTPDSNCLFDVDKYVDELKQLPEDMQPVCVCLFMSDVDNGLYKKFIERGIPVYTAGNVWDIRFVERYYNILRHFKYATSNFFGSYIFYSVEIGIPFSILGEKVSFYNVSNKNLPLGVEDISKCEAASDIFRGIHREITEGQMAFVNRYINDEDCLSRKEMRRLLYKACFKRGRIINDLFRLLKRKIRKK